MQPVDDARIPEGTGRNEGAKDGPEGTGESRKSPARCPCGQTPAEINTTAQNDGADKWAYAYGSCCGAWSVEYRNSWARGSEAHKLAREAWNSAPRGLTP